MLEQTLQELNSPYISFEQYFQEYVLSITDAHILREMQSIFNRHYTLKEVDKLISSMHKELLDDFEHGCSTAV